MFSPVSYHKTNFRSTTTCKSDSLFTRGEVVDPPSSVNALINTLRFFVELADGILWLQFTGGVMTPQWLSVIFLWFDLSTTEVVRRSSVGFLMRANLLNYCVFVGLSGIEPLTYRVSGERSTKLSYNPVRRMESLLSANLMDTTNHFPFIR